MSLTLAQAEATLVGPAPTAGAGLVGLALAATGLDATGESPVVALAPAISAALFACGVTPADLTAPTDADLASLTATTWPKFLDVASLLLLEQSAAGFVGGVKRIKFEDYEKEYFASADLNSLITTRRDWVRRRWGYGGGTITAGSVDYGFAQTDPCLTQRLRPWE
jgi:hypothetical protein